MRATVASLGSSLVAWACFDTSGLQELVALQAGIASAFHEPAPSINLNNRFHLTVTFENSSRAKSAPDERARFARAVGEYVRDNYPRYDSLQSVSVAFTTRRGVGPVHMTRTEAPYRFTPAQLGSAPRANLADTLPRRYRADSNRLHVAIGRLAAIRLADGFSYVGGQRFVLGGTADAEQHLFLSADSSGRVRRLVWIQIESFVPDQVGMYDYTSDTTVFLQGLGLAANSRVYTTAPATSSDRARAFALVESAGFRLPDGAGRLRLVYLPERAARREVMIVYLEAPEGSPQADGVAAWLSRAASAFALDVRP